MRSAAAELSMVTLVHKRDALTGKRLAGGALPGIGLAGPMGAGKDTTAGALADLLRHPSVAHVAGGRAARRVAFADVLKREAYRQALAVKSILTLRSGVRSALDVERAIVEDEALCAAFMPAGAPLPGGLVGAYCQIVADSEREGDTGAWDEETFIASKTPAKRVAYQLLGQAVRRMDPGYWVRAAVDSVDWGSEFPISLTFVCLTRFPLCMMRARLSCVCACRPRCSVSACWGVMVLCRATRRWRMRRRRLLMRLSSVARSWLLTRRRGTLTG